jgi:hypothetical protein
MKTNVWLVKSPEVSKQKFFDVFNLLNSIKGASEWAFQFKTIESKDEIECEQEEEKKSTTLVRRPWEYFFGQAEEFRRLHDLGNNEYVVVLSDHGNTKNWFSAADYGGNKNAFVHCEEWKYFLRGSDVRYPIAYQVAITVLNHHWLKNSDELKQKVHGLQPGDELPRGCMNDFCRNKEEVHLKMRTGDICEDCLNDFIETGVDKILIRHVLEILGSISSFMRFSNKWLVDVEPPKLSIEGQKLNFSFKELGDLTLSSSLLPLQSRVLYMLLYDLQKKGNPIGLNNFLYDKEFMEEFKLAYLDAWGYDKYFEHTPDTLKKVNKLTQSIDDLFENNGAGISRLKGNINKAFVNALGPVLAEYYSIQNIYIKDFGHVYIIGKNENDNSLNQIEITKSD